MNPNKRSEVFTIFTIFRSRRGAQPEQRGERQPQWQPGQGRQEEAAAAPADSLHLAAAAGAGGAVHEEPLPRHEHQGGDQHVDQPHRAQSQGEWVHDQGAQQLCTAQLSHYSQLASIKKQWEWFWYAGDFRRSAKTWSGRPPSCRQHSPSHWSQSQSLSVSSRRLSLF